MKKLLSLLPAACMLLTLAACTGQTADAEPSDTENTATEPPDTTQATEAPEAKTASYTYTFYGMMGEETAQIDLEADGACRFFLPGNPMITDVYVGTYTRDGDTVTIAGLANEDPASPYATPGLWDWIVDGNTTITVDDAAGTFTPAQ